MRPDTTAPRLRLAGKTAVITGIASGQGRAAAMLFAGEGATVVGCDLDLAGAEATVEAIRGQGGRADAARRVDLTHESSVLEWANSVHDQHERVDVLYANAAATRFAALEDISYQDWTWNFRHEVDVVFLPVRHFWPLLSKAGRSAVVLVGSTAGVTGSVTNGRLAHTATKGSVVAMTRQLAAEGAPRGIRVNCVSPGMIRTPATEADLLAEDHPMRSIAAHIPLGRVGEAEEVAKCALFLASDDASYVTGANLMVDGGWSAVLPG
ncbi:SDR family NAD(P)-dependent oxidoreductase [Paenarthrobacter aurescens]|uniref:SDR family NAD(P)-dependent oxidoreductase n=1 Tax=Paenarthrobacter aurescens TaxID=43663 RepID=UPI0021C2265D|nr:SDR family NAD(P)-dependent oxidoreductase [Paenarthrobacter aurescens]MCT9868185.1 SDR family oxidoreductase [Paenarthrobacter aurescens]